MAKATGQFTIIDYNDALTLTSFISSNQVRTQIHNPDNDTYTPDWSTSPFLVLTASLYKIGTATDIITTAAVQQVKFYEIINGTKTEITGTTNRVISGSKNHILTIKTNELSTLDAKDYFCVVTYLDSATGLTLSVESSISFSKITNGQGLTTAISNTPDGYIFKNDIVNTLTGECYLYRGSTIDTTNVDYQWYKQDSSVVVDEGGGIGWKKLTDTTGKYTGCTTATITVYNVAVTNVAVFKCIITDTDSSSSTYNTDFYDVVSFVDNTDPLVVSITSTGGSIFKNGTGSSTLRAVLYQAGYETDSTGTAYTYKWYRYDKDGNLDVDFGGSGISYKTGKSISVTTSDVDVKATFQVEVE